MTECFLAVLNMSITASVLVPVVLLLRLIFHGAPKWTAVLLWALVAIRLICPFAPESSHSLLPTTDWLSGSVALTAEENLPDRLVLPEDAGQENPAISLHAGDANAKEAHKSFSPAVPAAWVWLTGMGAMLLYALISTIRLKKCIATAVRVENRVWESAALDTPFVFGLIRPQIYLPRSLSREKAAYVIAHEEAHIGRMDHWWKLLGFFLLTVHWFNPLMWLSYCLFGGDIELACDQRAVKEYDMTRRADYAEALLECSVGRRILPGCPPAFGEIGVKARIKSVLRGKKPALLLAILALIACGGAAIGFLTNPIAIRNPWVREYTVGEPGILGRVDREAYTAIHEDFAIGADQYGRAVFKDPRAAFSTMKELYADGLALIAQEQNLAPISQRNYRIYQKFGWQTTTGSPEAAEQAAFITRFLDIYENSFTKDPPNTEMPPPTQESEADPPPESSETADAFLPDDVSQHSVTFTAHITAGESWEGSAYAGRLDCNLVEFISASDVDRVAALGLTTEDMPNGYYIYDEKEHTTTLKIPFGSEFIFYDWENRYTSPDADDKWVTTRDFAEFLAHYTSFSAYTPPFRFYAEEERLIIREIWIL